MSGVSTNGLNSLEEAVTLKASSSWPPALIALSMGSFAIGTTEFLPAALLPTIAADLKVTLASAGLLVSGYAMGVTLLTPILTASSSSWPRKSLLMGLMGMFFLTNALAALSPGYSFLLAMRFLTAFSHGVYFAVASTTAASLVPKGKEARAIAILFSGLTIAMATVVPAGAFLGQMLGWRMAFAATACFGLITVASIYLLVPELPVAEKRLSLKQQLFALKEPRLLLVLSMTTVGYAGTFATLTYLAATLEQVSRFSPLAVTLLFALIGVGVTIGNLLGGRIADFGLHRAIALLYGILAISLLIFWFAVPYHFAIVPSLFLFSMVMFSPGSGLQLLALQKAHESLPGSEDVAAGLNQSAFNLGIAIGAFVGGQVVISPLGLAGTPIISSFLVVMAIGLTMWSWKLNSSHAVSSSEAEIKTLSNMH